MYSIFEKSETYKKNIFQERSRSMPRAPIQKQSVPTPGTKFTKKKS